MSDVNLKQTSPTVASAAGRSLRKIGRKMKKTRLERETVRGLASALSQTGYKRLKPVRFMGEINPRFLKPVRFMGEINRVLGSISN